MAIPTAPVVCRTRHSRNGTSWLKCRLKNRYMLGTVCKMESKHQDSNTSKMPLTKNTDQSMFNLSIPADRPHSAQLNILAKGRKYRDVREEVPKVAGAGACAGAAGIGTGKGPLDLAPGQSLDRLAIGWPPLSMVNTGRPDGRGPHRPGLPVCKRHRPQAQAPLRELRKHPHPGRQSVVLV